MDLSQVYAIVMGGSFCLLLLINGLPLTAHLIEYLSPLISKHLIYRYVLHRHQLLGPWSRAGVLVQLIYIAGNICCSKFWDTTISQVGLRAGTVAIINLIPLFAGPHLGTLADLLGVTLSTFRQIHQSAGVTAVVLTIFHVLVMVASGFGIAAHLPYIKQLIHGYNVREVRARRIHLVWQVRDIDVTIAAQPLLNGALNENTLDDN